MELKGKYIAFLGDSITEGRGVDNQENRYDNVIAREYGLAKTQNNSISGSRIAHQSVPSEKPYYDLTFCGRIYTLDTAADICVVYGGVNDYIHGDAYIGEETDSTPATFLGGVNFLMSSLKEMYGDKPIIFLTPARMCLRGTTDELASPRPIKKPDAQPLVAYADMIIKAAQRHGVYVLDLFRELPINPNKSEDFERYTTDGLHLNDQGHVMLAHLLAEFIEKL